MRNMGDEFLVHHGIKGQRWGVRRFQNEDGSRTAAGKAREVQKLEKVKNRTMNTIKRRELRDQMALERNKAELSDLKKNGIHSEAAKEHWDSLTDEEKRDVIKRSDYSAKDLAFDVGVSAALNALTPLASSSIHFGSAEIKGREQLLKEDIEDLTTTNKRIVERGKTYTENYSKLSMMDVEKLASEYGYRGAKKQIKSMKKT